MHIYSRQNLIEPEELAQRLELLTQSTTSKADLRIIDSSWYLPNQQRDVYAEYQASHIPGAVFFDIDEVCDQSSSLPHMLPSADQFTRAVAALGIESQHELIVYDTAGIFSAARVWWMFKFFGHQQVRVLNGGLPAWQAIDGALSAQTVSYPQAAFHASQNGQYLASKHQLLAHCESPNLTVLDARSSARFEGSAPEPRPGLPSGHMPQSFSLPFDQLLEGGKMKPVESLRQIFESLGVTAQSDIVTTCGSGVTAAIITLALAEAGFGLQRLYDGAWAEWASSADTTILTGPV